MVAKRGPGRPAAAVILAPPERETLERWARRRTTAQALAMRARIVLACVSGRSNRVIAKDLGTNITLVTRWRSRFVERRLDGMLDEPRPGAPRRISDKTIESVITMTFPAGSRPVISVRLQPITDAIAADATVEAEVKRWTTIANGTPNNTIAIAVTDRIAARIRRLTTTRIGTRHHEGS